MHITQRGKASWLAVVAALAMLCLTNGLEADESEAIITKLKKDNADLKEALKTSEASLTKDLATAVRDAKLYEGKLTKAEKDSAGCQETVTRLKESIAQQEKLADEAKRSIAAAQSQHDATLQELEKVRVAVAQCQTKEADAIAKLQQADHQVKSKLKEAEDLLAAIKGAWLPHWAHEKYDETLETLRPLVESVSPTVEKAITSGRQLSRTGSAKVMAALDIAQTRSKEAWEVAHPHISGFLTNSKVYIKQGTETLSRLGAEHGGAAWVKGKQLLHDVLTSPQVKEIKVQAAKVQAELEDFAILHLKQYPALAPYALRPTVTYVLWSLMAAPLVALIAPLLLLRSGPRATKVPIAQPSPPPPTVKAKEAPATSQNTGKKGGKGRRITEGADSIRVP